MQLLQKKNLISASEHLASCWHWWRWNHRGASLGFLIADRVRENIFFLFQEQELQSCSWPRSNLFQGPLSSPCVFFSSPYLRRPRSPLTFLHVCIALPFMKTQFLCVSLRDVLRWLIVVFGFCHWVRLEWSAMLLRYCYHDCLIRSQTDNNSCGLWELSAASLPAALLNRLGRFLLQWSCCVSFVH